MSPAVLVTGGTGFLGSAVVRRLVERGRRVHVLARATSPRDGLDEIGCRFEEGDLTDASSVLRALEATAAESPEPPQVVHAGAVISYRSGDGELQRRVNVGGTRAVLEACRRVPTGRIVHVSSVVTVGHARRGSVLTEDTPFNGDELDVDYVTTKHEAEELALAATDLDLCVVNPGAIFGIGHRPSNTRRALLRLSRGEIRVAPPGTLGVVGLDDVAEGILSALERGVAGRRYLLVESNWSLMDVFGTASRFLGGPPVRFRLTPLLALIAQAVLGLVDRVSPRTLVTPQSLRMLRSSFASDSARARAELAWRPVPFESVLREVCEALLSSPRDVRVPSAPPAGSGAPRVVVVVPALDEEEALPRVLAEIPEGVVEAVVVCDNGSRDRTAEVAAEAQATVIREDRKGYGSACLAALSVALGTHPDPRARLDPPLGPRDVIVFLDADHSDYPEEITEVIRPILEDRAELVIGSRVLGGASMDAMLPQAWFGNRLACFLMYVLFGARYTDLGPFRAIRRDALDHLSMKDRDFGWTVEMQLKARVARLRVEEVPVRYRPRIGQSKITGTVSGTLRAAWKILGWIIGWRLKLWALGRGIPRFR